MASSREVLIIIDIADKTNNKLDGLKKSLLAIDAAAQKTRAKLASLGNKSYRVTLSLIDRLTPQGSKINQFLKSIASKTYTITAKMGEGIFNKIRSLEASLMRVAGKVHTITVNLKDNVSSKLKGIADGALMGMGGMGLGLMGGAGVGFSAVNAAQAYMGFEKQMSRVQAVAMLDKNSPEMQMLTQQAKDLGAQTAWTREQVGQAQYFQAMAGWSPELIQKATPAILNLASAGATDLATTSDIITDTLTGFQIKANETYVDSQGRFVNAAEHYADIMAKLVTSANTDIPQLGEALKYSSNVVGAMYADKDIQTRMHAAEDAMVMTGLMASAGVKSSMAGTATRAVFSRFGSENRNAYFGLQALGVDFKDANGEVRRIRDIFHDLNQRFSQGVSAEGIAEFAEMMTETKLHADTRRKLTSFMESVQKNGGKMTGADKLKLSSMLAGQEAMSGFMAAIMGDWDTLGEKIDNAHGAAEAMAHIQLDNLSGSLTLLGSAWDAFQQGFFEGGAGEGIRSFVDSLTDVISRANKLFADGIQFADVGKMVVDVIDRLKNKFMELDGIGSLLAGGALMAAFVKIGRMIQRVIGYAGQLKGLQIGQMLGGTTGAGAKGGTISSAAQVGTMNVTAGVVNLNGKIAGGVGGTGGKAGTVIGGASGAARTATGVAASGVTSAVAVAQQNLDKARADYNKLNSQLLAAQARRDNTWNYVSRLHAQGASDSQLATARGVARAESARFAQEQSKILPHLTAASSQMAQAQSRLRAAERSAASANAYYGQRQAFNEQINSRVAAYNAQIAQGKQIVADQRAAFTAMKSNFMGGAKGGAAFAAIFGAMDVLNSKSISEERAKEAADALKVARSEYDELVRQNADVGQLAQQSEVISRLQSEQNQILQENQTRERETLAGATGSVLGAAIGAGLGSLVGPMGTMIGGMIGSVLGDALGKKAAEISTPETEKRDFFTQGGSDNQEGGKKTVEQTPGQIYQQTVEESKMVASMHARRATGGATGQGTINQIKAANIANAESRIEATRAKIHAMRETHDQQTRFSLYDDYLKSQGSSLPMWGGAAVSAAQGYYQQQATQIPEQRTRQERMQAATAPTAQQFFAPARQAATTFNPYTESQNAIQRFKTTSSAATQTAAEGWSTSSQKFATVAKTAGENAFTALGAIFAPSMLIDKVFSGKAAAAELSPEQQAYQAQMERPRTLGEAVTQATQTSMEMGEVATPDLSAFTEIQSQVESFVSSIGESISGLGSTISEGLTSAFDGASEVVSSFATSIGEGLTSAVTGAGEMISSLGSTITEGLTSAFDGASEVVSNFATSIGEGLTSAVTGAGEMISSLGSTITDGLTTALTGAGEMFTSFGELVNSALTSAQATAASALSAINSTFESARSAIMSAWGELPGFFSSVFSGLGGAAAAAGSAIYSGLTSVIGAVIGAWQSAASTVSSIISSISAMASSAASMIPSFGGGGGGKAYAQGGFVNSPTQALIGEAGAEVVIPLSTSKRSRALDLFEKTAAILGHGAGIPTADFVSNIPELPASNNFSISADTPVTATASTSPTNAKAEISLGGVNVSFEISGVSDSDKVVAAIKERLSEVTNQIATKLSDQMADAFGNMAVHH